MSRSNKKAPYVFPRLLEKIEKMNETNDKRVLKTWSRSSTIYPQMVGQDVYKRQCNNSGNS